ncbi:hypothetical protein [Adhaeribacter aquaticus]|uniref:hypothetical protein n=1 Tax=Adhaeribacter aquaticus TaxID=299567 RepID=UPI000420AFFB|nr:hypothetical protein [Adhaeribacter aquaticus]
MADKTLFQDNITWDGQEADEIFTQPVFADPDLLGTVRVIPNIISKKKIAVDSLLDKILRAVNECGRNPSGKLITLSELAIEVERVGFDLEQCALALEDGFLEQFLNKGNKIFDLDGTYIKSYLEGKIVDALKLDIPRVIWFGDKASADPNYNMLDGLFKHMFALAATNSGMIGPAIPATLPDASTEAGAKAIVAMFKGLYDKQSRALKTVPANRKRFIVNMEIAEALQDAYTTLAGQNSGDIFIRRNQNGEGLDVFKYKNIDVIGMAHWTDIVETDFAGAQNLRMVLTETQNLVVGTDRIQDLMDVLFQYHPYPRVNTLEANFKLGTLVLLPVLTVYSIQNA